MNMLLCQTKYFKRLLEQTYSMRKEADHMRDTRGAEVFKLDISAD
jgi:hypothetical protein